MTDAKKFLNKPIEQLDSDELMGLLNLVSSEFNRRNKLLGKSPQQMMANGLQSLLGVIEKGLKAEAKEREKP
jgi:hypothetical protein